jgi:hypothetical protein
MSRSVLTFAIAVAVFRLSADDAVERPKVPKAWDQVALDQMDVPTADPAYSQKAVSPDYYYRIPIAVIYKSYPVYAPGRAPAGYMEKLRRLPPELAFNPARLRTKEDWIRAGEIVFDAPSAYGTDVSMEDVGNPSWYAATGVPIAGDGTIPWVRYVIRSTGNVEVGNLSCGFCHTRVLPDRSVVKGAQSNFAFDKAIAFRDRHRGVPEQVRSNWLGLFTVQWVPDMQRRLEQASLEEIFAAHEAIPPGVFARNRSSPFFPPAVPDLIGVADRRYLDRTGSTRHNNIGDLMRYDR